VILDVLPIEDICNMVSGFVQGSWYIEPAAVLVGPTLQGDVILARD
jgi:hypothetical protein